jgi:hypothetical protein
MQKGISLVDLAKRIEENQNLKADYIAPTRSIAMTLDTESKPQLEINDRGTFPILRTAHDQIASHADIPVRYYQRMLQEAPSLLADNVNRWFADNSKPRMLRTLAGDARALLSDRYQRIENEEIANVILPILMSEPGLQIVSCELTERRMYIQATTPRIAGEVKVGDEVQAGLLISNSEIGAGAVTIQPLVYRLVCLNGLAIPDQRFRARHLGRRIDQGEDLNAIFSDETRAADDRALLLKVRDVVKASLSEAGFNQTLDRMKGLTAQRIEANPEASVRMLARKVGILEGETPSILRQLIQDGDLSAWGMLNAVTAQAHTAPDYDRAVEFEQIGGTILDLQRKDWKEILEAA